ncbi:wiskott-Aldrich syndrome protein [Spatholobus suberectus]|nr:wiskott-Aldrich syndrome protein [Spatholobus suberectus]
MEEEEDMSPPFWTENGRRRRLRRLYSLFLSSGALLICVLVIALAFTLVLIPTLHSFAIDTFKPNSVKKSWASLNLVLILFAILCGFLSRNTNESFSDTPHEYEKPNPPTPRPWHEESDRTPYKSCNMLRSFNSYPDLRQESPWLAADERWRFYDDTHVNGYRGFDLEEESVKSTEVVAKEVPPPPLVVSPPRAPAERRSEQNKNKKTSAAKELLTSLKGKKKKKKQRQESVENVKGIGDSEPPSHHQPSSVFQNKFLSKKSKHKKLNPASSPPHVSLSKTEPVHGGVATSLGLNKREGFFHALEENVVTGNESPLNPLPPPPPPFKMPAWKFQVQGDFVRIDSISNSSSSSRDLEDEVVESPRSEDGGEPGPEILLLYPRPDVDTNRFRAGLRMEEKRGIGASDLRNLPKREAGPSRI